MNKCRGFTLIELLVVIAIIALLMSILMPALNRVKGQAKTVACQGRQKQWALIFSMYTNDNNGFFHDRPLGSSYEKMWPQFYKSYYSDPKLRCYPTAQNPDKNDGPFSTWGWKQYTDSDWGWGGAWDPEEGIYGSYGFSRYMLNKKDEANWRKTGVQNADEVPVFVDCLYVAMNPSSQNSPPEYNGARMNQMQYTCIDRHDEHVNGLFLDFSARKIGLKELWTLRWSRTFDTADVWTLAGGAQQQDWPLWMQNFKDY